MGNPIPRQTDVYVDEEEMQEEDEDFLNTSQTSQPSMASTVVLPQTMQIQREVFVLKGDYITPQDAEEFHEQTQGKHRLRVNRCMQSICFMSNLYLSDFSEYPEQKHDWQNQLSVQHVEVLILQHFCTNKQGDHNLAELFAKVPFHYSLALDEEELAPYMAYKELVTDFKRTRHVTAAQQAELVTILEFNSPEVDASNPTISSPRG